MAPTIRPLGPADWEACAAVIRAGFATVAAQFGLTPQNCPTNGAFITAGQVANAAARGHQFFGLYEGEALVGCVAVEPCSAGVCEMGKLAVVPACRHKGYGRRLLEEARCRAVQQGAAKLAIGIIEENTTLRRWYESCGFVHTGTRRFDDLPFTAGFMELALAQARRGQGAPE